MDQQSTNLATESIIAPVLVEPAGQVLYGVPGPDLGYLSQGAGERFSQVLGDVLAVHRAWWRDRGISSAASSRTHVHVHRLDLLGTCGD